MEAFSQKAIEALTWLRYSLNHDIEAPVISDWSALYAFADKQKLLGVCFPAQCIDCIEEDLLYQWIGTVLQIEKQNQLLNSRIEQLFNILEADGFNCCLLKGQGNAAMYPNHLMRCSGDIDIWVNSDMETICNYVNRRFPNVQLSFKHIHFPIFDDTKVDIHAIPLKFYSNRYGKRIQRWIEQNKNEQFSNTQIIVGLTREVCVPSYRFNVIYQLGHMLMHMIDEGVGLRQVVDYYYLLKSSKLSEDDWEEIMESARYLGLLRFAEAILWIENIVFGLPDDACLIRPNERLGKMILHDILEGGNFGYYSKRHRANRGYYYIGLAESWRILKLIRIAPLEIVSRLQRKMSYAVKHTMKIKHSKNK